VLCKFSSVEIFSFCLGLSPFRMFSLFGVMFIYVQFLTVFFFVQNFPWCVLCRSIAKGTHVSHKCIKVDYCSLSHTAAVVTQLPCQLAHIHKPRQNVPLLWEILNLLPFSVLWFLFTINMYGWLIWDTLICV
jgi:hypothetical protein